MPYKSKPKPCYIDQFQFYKVIDGRKVYRSKDRYYSWDEGGCHMYKNFIIDFFEEGLLLEDIDDYVEYWHANEMNQSLKDFLGLNDYEYEVWLQEGNDVIRDVLYCKRHNLNLKDYYSMSTGDKIAARSYDLKEVKEYKKDGEQGENS